MDVCKYDKASALRDVAEYMNQQTSNFFVIQFLLQQTDLSWSCPSED